MIDLITGLIPGWVWAALGAGLGLVLGRVFGRAQGKRTERQDAAARAAESRVEHIEQARELEGNVENLTDGDLRDRLARRVRAARDN